MLVRFEFVIQIFEFGFGLTLFSYLYLLICSAMHMYRTFLESKAYQKHF